MTEPDDRRKLAELEAKIEAAKAAKDDGKAHQEEHYSQGQLAWRMVTEMVAGLGIGFGIGYGLDVVLGTTPFLMVLFTLLGIAAGINVMMRSAREFQAKQDTRDAGEDEKRAEDGDGSER
ncbi:MAG: AtpZ/AtpI family protein [Paracoccaceae bacterium]|nr:AtpZ/AtpI family protein [Paracoccaceae bacterium]